MRIFELIPSAITQQTIRNAVVEYAIHQIEHPYKDSTDYEVIIDDRPYPPVAIMGIASSLTDGANRCPRLRGGEGTPCFKKFEELGFQIVRKGTHQEVKATRKKPRSWSDCLEVLDYKQWGYDPRDLFSLCLREKPQYSLNNYLGISSTGGKSGGKYGFQFKARNDFNRLEVYFKKKAVGLYLLINSTDDQYVEEVKINLSDKLREPFTWPESGNRINRAFNVNLETIGQYESVIEWLSSERVPNTRRLSFLENKTAKLKSEKPQLFEPTSDNEKLEANTSRLLESGLDEEPSGNPNPERSDPRESKGAFKRDPEVIAWVKQRAEGICELCEKEGPFLDKDNHPFLEVHHIVSLADGGSDKVDNAVAICPNCHRECHHGSNPEVLKLALLKKLQP